MRQVLDPFRGLRRCKLEFVATELRDANRQIGQGDGVSLQPLDVLVAHHGQYWL